MAVNNSIPSYNQGSDARFWRQQDLIFALNSPTNRSRDYLEHQLEEANQTLLAIGREAGKAAVEPIIEPTFMVQSPKTQPLDLDTAKGELTTRLHEQRMAFIEAARGNDPASEKLATANDNLEQASAAFRSFQPLHGGVRATKT